MQQKGNQGCLTLDNGEKPFILCGLKLNYIIQAITGGAEDITPQYDMKCNTIVGPAAQFT